MKDLLTRMAERAMGVRPIAMARARPVFAPPRKLVEREIDKPILNENAGQGEHVGTTTQPRNRETHDYDLGQERRGESPFLTRGASDESPRIKDKFPTAPTLGQIIEHIYESGDTDPRDAPEERKTANPERLFQSPQATRRAEREHPQGLQDDRIQNGPPSVESRIGLVVPYADDRRSDSDGRIFNLAKIRAQAEPAIHEVNVSIGRIELKAAAQTAAPAPLRTPSRPAHLSLNEYLERRRGGRS